jgi:hypothetical protein
MESLWDSTGDVSSKHITVRPAGDLADQRSSPPLAALPQIQDTTVSVPGRTLAKTASTFDINGRVSANRLL